MDLYVLDELLRRTALIDQYESLIWTERYKELGDFELVIRSDRGVRALLLTGTRLAILPSNRIMVVETVENTVNGDGVASLKVTGRSIEKILLDRVNRYSELANGTTPAMTTITGTPEFLINSFFNIIRQNSIIQTDNIPFLKPGKLLPPGTIPMPTETINYSYETDLIYNNIKALADMYDLGFRIVRNGDTSELYFEVYTGDDRTTLQKLNSTVVFSPELDNLSDTTELTATADVKNVAYVFGKNGSRIVYADTYDSTISGFNRRVMLVNASNIELPAGPALQLALEQRGKEELSTRRPIVAFDGEISQFGNYVYGVHYDLGDLVEMRNADGLATNVRVTEQIFASDAEGVRSYPTFTINLLITPGSWFAWDASQVWDAATGTWSQA